MCIVPSHPPAASPKTAAAAADYRTAMSPCTPLGTNASPGSHPQLFQLGSDPNYSSASGGLLYNFLPGQVDPEGYDGTCLTACTDPQCTQYAKAGAAALLGHCWALTEDWQAESTPWESLGIVRAAPAAPATGLAYSLLSGSFRDAFPKASAYA